MNETELTKRQSRVYKVLKKHKTGIDTLRLGNESKNTRPSNIISELRKLGFKIKTVYKKNEATGSYYGVYILEE